MIQSNLRGPSRDAQGSGVLSGDRTLPAVAGSLFLGGVPMTFDVWLCSSGGRRSWRATEHRDDDSLRPGNAVAHADTVQAPNKRAAIRRVARDWSRG